MSRDQYEHWDDEQGRDSDRYGVPGGHRRTSRSARPQQPWLPESAELDEGPVTNQNSYPGHYRDDGHSDDGYGAPPEYGCIRGRATGASARGVTGAVCGR